ncbi:MAG TPA: hypothetical protein PLI05_09050 [Methanotrichaceae archaeon]|nr:hypothetical protein [Methanotrichaceae archaeon]HQF17199.1 hypothetical protein [Methanotrichaceae archaeon]HQI91772.1 hypothetical protein [Methanotrichaceae archaeon]HQJ29027.1 hypothetical protein [Methanotrichaceae archaeon]
MIQRICEACSGGRPFIRNVEAERLLEIFLVSSVTAILAIRFFLKMTGFPQLGGGGLHIAHVLLGGLFMLVALVILLAFIDWHSRNLAAVIGGLGFGAFIDEIGKFVTSDNNYFFQPAIALIYIVFVMLYIAVQSLNGDGHLCHQEKVANVLEITKEVVLDDLDIMERKKALELLEGCDKSDPLVKALRNLYQELDSIPAPPPGLYSRAKELVRRIYHQMIAQRWFSQAVVVFFVIQSLVSIIQVIFLVAVKSLEQVFHQHLIDLSPSDWMMLAASALAALLVVRGVLHMRKDRLSAFHQFKSAVLVQIFLVQTLAFYRDQLTALAGLALNILVLAVLRYMIAQEEPSSA